MNNNESICSSGVRHVYATLDHADRRFDMGDFRALLNDSKKESDLIFVEMPSLMPSPNIELIVNAVEDLLLIVEAMNIKGVDLQEVHEKLFQISARSLVVVVNKVPLEHGHSSLKRQFVEWSVAPRAIEIIKIM